MILSGSPDPAELARARRAIANIESRGSGGYSALGPVIDNPRSQFYGDRAYGAYQVMGRNVGPWTRKVFGREMTPEQFLADPQAQDALFDAMFGPVMASAGPEGAASWWFTGSTAPRNVSDTLGTTANEYQRRFIREFGNSGNEPMANGMSAPYTPPAAGAAAQPAGLLPQPARRPSIWSDPETWESIALALNPLRTNPDPNLAQQIEGRRASRTDERRRNMTAQWLRSQGMTQYADLVEGGMMAGDEAVQAAMSQMQAQQEQAANAQQRNMTAEALDRIAPGAAVLIREGLLSPTEALKVAQDQGQRAIAAQAAEAIARGDFQTAFGLSMQLSPTAAGQAIAQGMAPRPAEVVGGGRYTITYDAAGNPKVQVNEDVIEAERGIARTNAPPPALPAAALKSEEEDFAAIDAIDALQDDIRQIIDDFGYKEATGQFEGPLQIGVGGFIEGALGGVGVGGAGAAKTARARERFDRFRTRLVNASLRLNAGVQTEGDAQRAAQELGDARTTAAAYAAINDLMQINERARGLRERAIMARRERFGGEGVTIPPAPEAPNLNWRIIE